MRSSVGRRLTEDRKQVGPLLQMVYCEHKQKALSKTKHFCQLLYYAAKLRTEEKIAIFKVN